MENVMGQRIRELRQKQGLTQERLGEYIGVSRGAINKIEKGTTENLKRSQIETLAEKLGCTPTYLMGWEDKNSSNYEYDQIFENENYIREITNKRTQNLYERKMKQYLKSLISKVEEEVSSKNDIYNIIQRILESDKLYYSTFELDDETTNNIKVQLKILSSYIQFQIERNK